MNYLLDTNACVAFLRRQDSTVARKLATVSLTDVVVCAIVKAELYYGIQRSTQPQANWVQAQNFLNNFISLPFDDDAAEVYGRIRAQLAVAGTPIGPNDLMIAAIALANDLILVTHNTREFSRVQGLRREDWEA